MKSTTNQISQTVETTVKAVEIKVIAEDSADIIGVGSCHVRVFEDGAMTYNTPDPSDRFLPTTREDIKVRQEALEMAAILAGMKLYDYQTGEPLRAPTADEHKESVIAAVYDGGAGVIKVEGRSCYVA